MKIVIEILDESDDDFAMDLLGWMERDRNAGSPISLETTNYQMDVRIVGIVTAEDCPADQKIMVVEELEGT